jgi:hypothetical protein
VTAAIEVAVIAGRRPDPADADTARFPLANVDAVRSAIAAVLRSSGARTLVASAACGADLLGLDAAGQLGMRRVVVLPYGVERFRQTSVTDRPGDWGAAYDAVIADVRARGDLEVIETAGDDAPYAAITRALVKRAAALTGDPSRALVVIAWEGSLRGHDDQTGALRDRARALGMPVAEVNTLHPDGEPA